MPPFKIGTNTFVCLSGKVVNKASQPEPHYRSGIKLILEYMDKEQAKQYYQEKIKEESDKLQNWFASKKDFLLIEGNPDWWVELGLEVINARIKERQQVIKNLVFKLDLLENPDKADKFKVTDLEAIKAIPIADIMPNAPDRTAINRLYYKAPWRNETQASVVVYADSNRWFDFGEQIGGTVIDMFMRIYELDFKTAVKELNKLI